MLYGNEWIVKADNGQQYTAIGYENRGIFSVPVAKIVDGYAIQCTVYEIVNGMIRNPERMHISICRPNNLEIDLLEKAGWKYTGCFATLG